MKVGGRAAPAIVLAFPAVALAALRLLGIQRGPRSRARTGVCGWEGAGGERARPESPGEEANGLSAT